MDQTDARILSILQHDGRISMQKLAAQINMSAPSTIERVKKLEESGAILGYRAVVNPEKVGRAISAVVLFAVTPENRRRFTDYANANPNVIEILEITGHFSFCLRTCCKDANAFMNMTQELIDMGLSESYVVLTRPGLPRPIQPIL